MRELEPNCQGPNLSQLLTVGKLDASNEQRSIYLESHLSEESSQADSGSKSSIGKYIHPKKRQTSSRLTCSRKLFDTELDNSHAASRLMTYGTKESDTCSQTRNSEDHVDKLFKNDDRTETEESKDESIISINEKRITEHC